LEHPIWPEATVNAPAPTARPPAPPHEARKINSNLDAEPDAELDKSGASVRAMFSAIARTYDTLNHGLSLNLDRRWRRRAVSLLSPRANQRILDLCCGTGDLSLEIARRSPSSHVVGLDFALPMLRLALPKSRAIGREIPFVAGDALRLPLRDSCFDAVAVAFGARNFESTRLGIEEAARVLKPGGKLLVLEFMRPSSPLVRRFFGGFNAILAPIGKVVSGHPSAYKYLPQSVGGFYTRDEFARLLRECGFTNVRSFDYALGVSTAFVAEKPALKYLEAAK
jgi:demethylmenaquinone methyltransferase/2-methoxy-6-polyprenyl-1,4-benzoquinol methylase